MTRRRKLIFAVLPLLLLLAGGEGGLRLLDAGECRAPQPDSNDLRQMQADPETLWSLIPNRPLEMGHALAWVGPQGIREKGLPGPKSARERRIVTLGDSSVFGWDVPDGLTFQDRLEIALYSADRIVRVVNLGVPGFSSVQSIRLLDRVGWAWSPDVILVGNIFSDSKIEGFRDERALALVAADHDAVHRALARSRIYCTLWNAYAWSYARHKQGYNRVLMPGVVEPTRFEERLDRYLDLSRVPLARYEENLETIRRASVAHGARMVLMPLAQEWDVGVWTVGQRPPPEAGEGLAWTPYREVMARFAEREGVPLVSMPEAFAAAAKLGTSPLFVDAVHPSPQGAAVMADALARFFLAHPEVLDGGGPADGGNL